MSAGYVNFRIFYNGLYKPTVIWPPRHLLSLSLPGVYKAPDATMYAVRAHEQLSVVGCSILGAHNNTVVNLFKRRGVR